MRARPAASRASQARSAPSETRCESEESAAERFGNDRKIHAHRELDRVPVGALDVEHARHPGVARRVDRPARGVGILGVDEQRARLADRVAREIGGAQREARIAVAEHAALAVGRRRARARCASRRPRPARTPRDVDAGRAQRRERELGVGVGADRAEQAAREPEPHRREHGRGDLTARPRDRGRRERELLARARPARQRGDAVERDLAEADHVDRARARRASRAADRRRARSVEHPVDVQAAQHALHVAARLVVRDLLDPDVLGRAAAGLPARDRLGPRVVAADRRGRVAVEAREQLAEIGAAELDVDRGPEQIVGIESVELRPSRATRVAVSGISWSRPRAPDTEITSGR